MHLFKFQLCYCGATLLNQFFILLYETNKWNRSNFNGKEMVAQQSQKYDMQNWYSNYRDEGKVAP